jgi:RNA polymerase sigma factor (sigma-70 family)
MLRRDRLLEEFLRDRSRRETSALPALPDLAALQRALPDFALYAAPVVEDELFLLTVTRHEARLVPVNGAASPLREQIEGWRGCLAGQLARYRHGLPLGPHERDEADDHLDSLGRGPLGEALFSALSAHRPRPRRLVWVPDSPLHGLPVSALRRGGRYLIEDVEVVSAFSGALLVHLARTRRQGRGRLRPALVVTEAPDRLPAAEEEGRGVAGSFLWRKWLTGAGAGREAVRRGLARARVAHFACHADFDAAHPLAATLHLPSGEAIRALDWPGEPVAGMALVTLSACRSAEVASLPGNEVFGLVTGLLGAGVRAVLAGLWPVADEEARPFMWSFYRHRLAASKDRGSRIEDRGSRDDSPRSSILDPLSWRRCRGAARAGALVALVGTLAAAPARPPIPRPAGASRPHRHSHGVAARKTANVRCNIRTPSASGMMPPAGRPRQRQEGPMAQPDQHQLEPLLARALTGDTDAFADLLQRIRPYLFFLVRRHVGPGSVGAMGHSDLVQSVLGRLCAHFHTLRERTVPGLLGYVGRIVRNRCLGAKEAAQRKPVPLSPQLLSLQSERMPWEKVVERDRRALRVADALRRLPDYKQQAVELFFLDQLSDAEISERIGGNPDSLRVVRCRALKDLRKLLTEDPHVD